MPDFGVKYDFPKKAVFAFLKNETAEYARQNGCEQIGSYLSITKIFPIYKTMHLGQEVCFCQAPVGASAAVGILDFLIAQGAREIIAIGCCGALEAIAENAFLIPIEALRDEGTSYHYLPPERSINLEEKAIDAIKRSFEKKSIPYELCKTWSTDGFFRETAEMVKYRKEEGCSVVDMECSALAACAAFRNVLFGQILFTADTLADTENYDVRSLGREGFARALPYALDAVCEM